MLDTAWLTAVVDLKSQVLRDTADLRGRRALQMRRNLKTNDLLPQGQKNKENGATLAMSANINYSSNP